MLNNKFQEYVQLEKNYMTYREDYRKICELNGRDSAGAVQMYEFLQIKMRELIALNDEILNARISYVTEEELENEQT